MNNIKKYFFLSFLFISAQSFGQQANLLLLDRVEDRVMQLKNKLDLSEPEIFKLTNVLVRSTSDLASLDILQSGLEAKRNAILAHRDLSIKNILGDKRLKLFKLLEEIEKEELLLENTALIQSIIFVPEANEAIINYRLKYILPILSRVNQEFVSTLSIDRIIKLRELRSLFYQFAQELKDQDAKSGMLFSSFIGSEYKKDLLGLKAHFNDKMVKSKSVLDPLRLKWSNDQDAILLTFLEDVNISSEQKSILTNGQFKMKDDLFVIHMLMLVPFDKSLYLQNLDVTLNQQRHFERIIAQN